mgnify:CR=1 FL=1
MSKTRSNLWHTSGYLESLNLHTSHQLQKAFKTIELLEQKRIPLSRDILYSLLQECIKQKDIISGRRVHSLMIYRGLDTITCFSDHLIHLFIACGSLSEGKSVFDHIRNPKTTTWNAIISGHVALGECGKALSLYQKMQEIRVSEPDRITMIYALKACGIVGDLRNGRHIHVYIIEEACKVVCKDLCEEEVMLINTLIDMYAKCKSIEDAFDVFDGLSKKNVTSWTIIVSSYVQKGLNIYALKLFEMMIWHETLEPDESLLLVVLKACSSIRNVVQGRRIHDLIVKSMYELDVYIINTLVDMYSKCGSLEDARLVFEELPDPDDVAWCTMITGYTENGLGHEALNAYKEMKKERKGMRPSAATLYAVSKACTIINDLEQGMLIHDEIQGTDMESDLLVRTGLIEMYSKCGRLDEASRLFDDSLVYDHVLWEAMITQYIQHGNNQKAIEIFEGLSQEGLQPRIETYTTLLKACGNGDFHIGWLIHDRMVRNGHKLEHIVAGALVNMYAKRGNLDEARNIFDSLHDRTVMSWGGMIAGYAQQGFDVTALGLFSNMLKDGMKPDKATLSCILTSCANLGALKEGQKVHELILEDTYESDLIVTSSLLDMYSKCGSLNEACKVFDSAAYRDVVSWGAVIASCTQHGDLDLAFWYLTDMKQWGLKPSNIIFTSMLTACCSTGVLEEGYKVFKLMTETYEIVPDKEHYSCIIDLLSRAGYLHDGLALLSSIPTEPDTIMWTSLLTGCKIYGNVEMGNECYKKLLQEVNPKDMSAHVLMSQIWSDACGYE